MPFAALLVALARKRKKSPASLRGCIEMDPLGVLAHEGTLPQSLDGAYREMAALTRWAAVHAPQLANHLRPQPRLARSRRQRRAGTGLHAGHRRRISARNGQARSGRRRRSRRACVSR